MKIQSGKYSDIFGYTKSIENSDWVCILYQETKQDTEQPYMAFKLIKRRYRSSEEDEKLRRLEYFYHPYEPENSIALIDDINMPKSLSLYSLASELPAPEELKRGKKNSTKRPKERDVNSVELELGGLVFGDFDENQSTQF